MAVESQAAANSSHAHSRADIGVVGGMRWRQFIFLSHNAGNSSWDIYSHDHGDLWQLEPQRGTHRNCPIDSPVDLQKGQALARSGWDGRSRVLFEHTAVCTQKRASLVEDFAFPNLGLMLIDMLQSSMAHSTQSPVGLLAAIERVH